jgi:hypothetical protein
MNPILIFKPENAFGYAGQTQPLMNFVKKQMHLFKKTLWKRFYSLIHY